jgi:hypothetical protein
MLSDLEGVLQDVWARSVAGTAPDSGRLGFEIEMSAQIALAQHWYLYKVGISYYDRTYDERKKINWRDRIEALFYLLKLRLVGAWFRPKILSVRPKMNRFISTLYVVILAQAGIQGQSSVVCPGPPPSRG